MTNTPGPPSASGMRIAALLIMMTTTAAADGLWLHAGAALGGGGGRLGPIAGSAFVDGHLWPSRHTGVFATVLGFAASEGEQEGRHVQGSLAAAGIAFRGVQPGRFALVPYHLSIGLGAGRASGVDWTGHANDKAPFEDRGLAWTVRGGVGYMFKHLHIGTQVVAYGFVRGGFAIAPFCLVVGTSW